MYKFTTTTRHLCFLPSKCLHAYEYQNACLPACQPACLTTTQPKCLPNASPACLPAPRCTASLPACLPPCMASFFPACAASLPVLPACLCCRFCQCGQCCQYYPVLPCAAQLPVLPACQCSLPVLPVLEVSSSRCDGNSSSRCEGGNPRGAAKGVPCLCSLCCSSYMPAGVQKP